MNRSSIAQVRIDRQLYAKFDTYHKEYCVEIFRDGKPRMYRTMNAWVIDWLYRNTAPFVMGKGWMLYPASAAFGLGGY